MSEHGDAARPGWWLASDGNWYPPESHPSVAGPAAHDPGAAAPSPGAPVDVAPVAALPEAVAPTPSAPTHGAPDGGAAASRAAGTSPTLVVGVLAGVAALLLLVVLAVVVIGRDGGDVAAAGDAAPGEEVEVPSSPLPLDSEDRGCYEDSNGVGCGASPAPAGTTFVEEDLDYEITYVEGVVRRSDTGDPLNTDRLEVVVTLQFTYSGDAPAKISSQTQFPYYVVAFLDGSSLSGCDQDPFDGTIEPGTPTTVTWTCATTGPSEIVDLRVSAQLESDRRAGSSANLLLTTS